jgi:hypothetical protein
MENGWGIPEKTELWTPSIIWEIDYSSWNSWTRKWVVEEQLEKCHWLVTW